MPPISSWKLMSYSEVQGKQHKELVLNLCLWLLNSTIQDASICITLMINANTTANQSCA